jgi:A/G-specific adenine glycosylase
MMDLGATICRPRAPSCGICPLRGDCAGHASGAPESFPAAKARRVRPNRRGSAWWIERDGQVWLVRRPANGLLGGMPALPGTEWDESTYIHAPLVVRHVFTHFALELAIERRPSPAGDGWWHPIETLDQAGLPTLYGKAAQLVLEGDRRRAA